MKTIATPTSVIGIYNEVIQTVDTLFADGQVMPITSLGTYEVVDGVPPGAANLYTRVNSQWVLRTLSPDEQAAQAEQTRVAAIDSVIIGDTTIANLKAMTNADFDTWWSTNVTTLAQANNVLKRIARIVLRRVL